MDPIKSLLGRVKGCPAGADRVLYVKVLATLDELDSLEPQLAARTAAFVVAGAPGVVMLALRGHHTRLGAVLDPREYWLLSSKRRRAIKDLYAPKTPWDAAAFYRLGLVLASGGDQGLICGTPKTPSWLRALLSLHHLALEDRGGSFLALPPAKAAPGLFTLPRLLEMLALARDGAREDAREEEADREDEAVLLDILCHRCRGLVEPSLPILPGAADFLRQRPQAVEAAVGVLDAAGRAELARAITRMDLLAPYAGLMLDLATDGAKSVRQVARQGLHRLDRKGLEALLPQRLAEGTASRRGHAAELAAGLLGPDAKAMLEAQLGQEKGKKMGETLRTLLARLDSAPQRPAGGETAAAGARQGIGKADGEVSEGAQGAKAETALDGTPLSFPAPLEPGPDEPLDAAAFAPLEQALRAYHAALKAHKPSGLDDSPLAFRRELRVRDRDLRAFRACVNGEDGYAKQEQGMRRMDVLVHNIAPFEFDGAGIEAFFANPALGVPHLLRLLHMRLVYFHSEDYQGLFDWLAEPPGDRVFALLQRKLEGGVELRELAYWWRRAGGREPLEQYLRQVWRTSLERPPAPGFDAYLLEHLDLLDAALGMTPLSGDRDRPLSLDAALEVLAVAGQVPDRYRLRLMELATGSHKGRRHLARRILRAATGIDPAIAELLRGGRQEVRAGAAQWLAERNARAQIPALHRAVKKERSELARAAMLTALEHLGEELGAYFDPRVLRQEADKGLAKANLKGLQWFPLDRLPALAWRDGAPLDPQVLRWWVVLANKLKQAGGNALFNLYLDRLQPADAEALGLYLLHAWIDYDTRRPSEQEAVAHAEAHVDRQLQAWSRFDPDMTRDKLFAILRNEKRREYFGSAIANKGLLGLAVRAPGAEAARAVAAYLREHGGRTAQAKALLEALAHNPDPAALQQVLAVADRFRARSVQEFARALVEAIAERRGWDPQQLADRTVPSAGLDRNGVLALDCGAGRLYSARLDAEGRLELRNPAGKVVKSLPAAAKAGAGDGEPDPVQQAKAALASARNTIRQVFTVQAARLQQAMCLQRTWGLEEWRTYLLGHPLVSRLCQRLVWMGLDDQGRVCVTFRPLADGTLSDAEDREAGLEGVTRVGIAHRALLDAAQCEAWVEHLEDYEVQPLFEQFRRPLLAAPRGQSIDDRRGWMVESFALRSVADKLGYQRGEVGDGGIFMEYIKRYEAADLVAIVQFTGSVLPEQNVSCALLDLVFLRLHGPAGGWGAAVDPGQVPPVLLSETWNDYHAMAEVGSGFDPEWASHY